MSIEFEMACLGAVLLENECWPEVATLKPENFSSERTRLTFEAMRILFDKGEACDLVTLTAALRHQGSLDRVGGISFPGELVDSTPTAANVGHYVGLVREQAQKRALLALKSTIVFNEGQDIAETLERLLRQISAIQEQAGGDGGVTVQASLKAAVRNLEAASQNPGELRGLPTGLRHVDLLLGGLRPGQLIIVGGRPGTGKTSLIGSLVESACLGGGTPTAIFSLEMGHEELTGRFLCGLARIDQKAASAGRLRDSDFQRLTEAAGRLHQAKLFIDDAPGLSVSELSRRARQLKRKHATGLIVVDYLQLLRGAGRSRVEEVGDISRSLKGLAKELAVPIVALAQLNRALESRSDKRPSLADLRESGSIEQDADVVMMLHRPGAGDTTEPQDRAEIIISKQRSGPTGTVKAGWNGAQTRFYDLGGA